MKYLVEDCDNPADPVQDYAEAKEIIRRVLGSHPSVRQAGMFGSFVRGEQVHGRGLSRERICVMTGVNC